MVFFYLDPGKTDLMDIPWIKQVREENEETKKPRRVYQHGDTCLHGNHPESIVQGRGIGGIYWKRCDGRFINALGEHLDVSHCINDDSVSAVAGQVDCENEFDEERLAEMAWRRRKTEDSDDEDEAKVRRKYHCIVM